MKNRKIQNSSPSPQDAVSAAKDLLEKIQEEKSSWLKWLAICGCMVLAIMLFVQRILPESADAGLPSLLLDNRLYYISSHQSGTETLPDGFVFQGETDVAGTKGCPYFINPDHPYWVYVYHSMHTDGTINGSADTNVQKVYVRYVDSRLRDRDMVCYDGKLYVSMWSAQCTGEYPDVTAERYSFVNKTYGMRIEGDPLEGFSYAGDTVFCGYDWIPRMSLESNFESAQLYANPDDPQIVLVSTRWYTADQGKQVVHEGCNVYVLYEGTLE